MHKRVAMALVCAMGLVAAVSTTAIAETGDADTLGTSCNNVDITVKNNKSDQIKVTRIGYQVNGTGTLHTEGLDDKEIGKNGKEKTWSNQKLQHAPEGSKLVFKVFFKNDKAGGWGDETSQSFDKQSSPCTDGKGYKFIVD